MNHPKLGERVRVIPASGLRVQRGEAMFGQFLPADGQEVLWDEFLHQRLQEGAITWKPAPVPDPVVEVEAAMADREAREHSAISQGE